MPVLSMLRVYGLLAVMALQVACVATGPEGSRAHQIADANMKLGVGYLRQDRLEDALLVLQKALDAEEDFGDAHSAIAIVYERLSMIDEAEDHYRWAKDLQPKEGSVYNNYGGFLCRQKKYIDAEYYFKKALTFPRYSTPQQVYENAGLCAKRMPDMDKAEKYFRQALDIDRRLPRSLLGMAYIMYDKKRYLSSRAYLQRYEAVSAHGSASLELGIKVERLLKDQLAVNRYEKQLRIKFPDSPEYSRWLNETSQGDTAP